MNNSWIMINAYTLIYWLLRGYLLTSREVMQNNYNGNKYFFVQKSINSKIIKELYHNQGCLFVRNQQLSCTQVQSRWIGTAHPVGYELKYDTI